MGFLLLRLIQQIMVEPGLELGQADSRAHTLNLTVLSTLPLSPAQIYSGSQFIILILPSAAPMFLCLPQLQTDLFLLDPKRDIQTW